MLSCGCTDSMPHAFTGCCVGPMMCSDSEKKLEQECDVLALKDTSKGNRAWKQKQSHQTEALFPAVFLHKNMILVGHSDDYVEKVASA